MSIDAESEITNIKSITVDPIKNRNIKLIKLVDNITDYILHFEMDTYPIKIITDFNRYCFAESPIDLVNINDFNIAMAFKKKVGEVILLEMTRILEEPKGHIPRDSFHIFQKLEEFAKYQIDYAELGTRFNSSMEKSKDTQMNNKIPKELLLSTSQVSKLIINEIKVVNRSKEYEHYIIPDKVNPYLLTIRLKFNATSDIGNKMKIINDKYNYDYMEFNLLIDSKAHPLIPPKIEYVKPRVKLPLLLALINLDILKLSNWRSTITLDYLISNLGKQLEQIDSNYILTDTNGYSDLEYEFIKLASITKEEVSDKISINISTKSSDPSTVLESKYWKSGTGYGYGSDNLSNWDIKSYIADQEVQKYELSKCLSKINSLITNINNSNDSNIDQVTSSVLIRYLIGQVRGINLLEIEKSKNLYTQVFRILENLADKPVDQSFINDISNGLRNLFDELELLFKTSPSYLEDEFTLQTYCLINHYMSRYQEPTKEIIISTDIKELYCDNMKSLQFGTYDLPLNHRFIKHKGEKPNQKALMRILSEITSFKTSLPLNWESTIWVRVPKDGFNIFSFLISGPKDTPYENGLFEFHGYFPQDYPNTVPEVLIHTTGNGTVRFNPNLYDSGKVCLSLLGTWQGQEGEKWNSKTSTFLQVLVSIQSLILVEDPYFNEPGWERQMNTDTGKAASKLYNEERQPSTIKLAMTDMITNPPKGFEEVVKRHFTMKKDEIINKTEIWLQNSNKHKVALERNRNELLSVLAKL